MIRYKINLSKEELEKYSSGEWKVEIELCNEKDEVVEKKLITKRKMKSEEVNERKRKRNNEEVDVEEEKIKKLRKEDKVKVFMKELSLPMTDNKAVDEITDEWNEKIEEIDDIRKLVEKYLDLEDENSKMIWKYFYMGQGFERKVTEKRNQEREKTDQTIRKELYNEMMKFLVKENENDDEKENKRKALKEKIRGTIVIYELFMRIGQGRINNVKETA
ncbi:hypothetical protein RhiirA4_487323, partial [Rhizophagus irregularis]